MEEIQFVEMTEEHLDAVTEIYNYYILETTATFHIVPVTAQEMREIVFFDEPRYRTFIITVQGTLCGYVLVCPFKKREAYRRTAEVTVYLRHDCTGRGVGFKAVKYIEGFAASQGISVCIAVICGENAASIRLFEKCGYAKCAHYHQLGEKFNRLLDVVAYEKHLTAS